jgi:receptor protein-tyrosine kinase
MNIISEDFKVEPLLEEDAQRNARPLRIGEILVRAQKLRPDQINDVLALQTQKKLTFGESALRLRLVKSTDVREALAEQFSYPMLKRGSGSSLSLELVAAYEPHSEETEQLRSLRNELLVNWFEQDDQPRTLAVVGAGRREGRSYLVANLAVVFAQLGRRVIVVDADLRTPRQHEIFGVANRGGVGLSSILSGRCHPEPVHLPEFGALALIPAGPLPPNPQELLLRADFKELSRQLAEDYDFVLFDTSAATFGDDPLIVTRATLGALIVGRRNHTRLDGAQVLAEKIRASRQVVVGAVMNRR